MTKNLNLGNFFDSFEDKYLQIANFSGKYVSFKLKVILSANALTPFLRKISKYLILG